MKEDYSDFFKNARKVRVVHIRDLMRNARKRRSEELYSSEEEQEQSLGITNKTHVWSELNGGLAKLLFYCAQKAIKELSPDELRIKIEQEIQYEVDVNVCESIIVSGSFVFTYENVLYLCEANIHTYTLSIRSNGDVSFVVNYIEDYIKNRNPLKCKNIKIVNSDQDEMGFIYKNIPSTSLNDVVIEDKIKEDLFDNTVLHLKNLDGQNGILLYGPPGTGKSLISQALISECIKNKINTCFTTNYFDFTAISRLLERYLDCCLLTIEDIDTIAKDREEYANNGISDFLQFLSGVSETDSKFVVLATTNHVDKLDKAVSNRPVRFNRKIKFPKPDKKQLMDIVNIFFKDSISEELKKLCLDSDFTGAHIRELYRTCKLSMSKKNLTTVTPEIFTESIKIIKDSFSVSSSYISNSVI